MSFELGVIGAGNMAEAIVRGILRAGLLTPAQVIVSDVSPQRRDLFTTDMGVRAVEDNRQVVAEPRTILLCVKPYQLEPALAGIGSAMRPDALLVSILAAVSTAAIEQHLGQGRPWRVVRAMPNTPVLVGEGMVAIAPGAHATAADLATARRLFEAAAGVVEIAEDRIDAVTAVSGSGPAYFYYVVEHMVRAGIELGLTPEQAHQLAARTCLGAGKMLVATPEAPADLRRKVTTPGGTTHAAITTMDAHGMGDAIFAAVLAADRRAKEMAVPAPAGPAHA